MSLWGRASKVIGGVRDAWFWIDQKAPRWEETLTEEGLADAENGLHRIRKRLQRAPKRQ